ncbi:hypothetical protein MTO96_035093 [Rhipicephalus appendiculatus]
MADSIPEDPPDQITARTQARATATSRPSAPRKSPATTIRTRAQKLKAAASRPQKDSASSTPTSRPRVRSTRKLSTTRRRQAPKGKANTAKITQQTAAATTEEAATAISAPRQPATLHLVPVQQHSTTCCSSALLVTRAGEVVLAVYGELGLPRAMSQNPLFPACRREHIKRALSALLDFVDGSGLRERIQEVFKILFSTDD